jgi:FkbM family methyltransferase
MRLLKRTVRRALWAIGYDVQKIPDSHVYHVNDYADMRFILNQIANPIIFDVGANHGLTVDRFLTLFPGATVLAVEANPELARSLMTRYHDDPRVKVVGQALSDRSGTTAFYVSNDAIKGMSSMLPWKSNSTNAGRTEQCIEVETVRLDELCRQRRVETIDILKLDIQGAELLALAGAGDLLRQGAIKLVYLEIWFIDNDYQDQCHFIDVYQSMRENQYVLYGLYNTTQPAYTPNQPLIFADAIFIHCSLAASLDTSLTGVIHKGKLSTLNGFS